MATSGTWAFTLDLPEIIEQAYERIGAESRSGWDYRTARKSLDLLMLEWQNRGTNLWTVKNDSLALTAGQASYALDPERIDIIEAAIRTDEGSVTNQTDINMKRVSISTHAKQTNKLSQGRPTQYYVQRTPTEVNVILWPVPDTGDYVFNYWYMERIEDTGRDGTNTMDVPARFLPALVAGLAYQLALKDAKAFPLLPVLKEEYMNQWDLAADAAREKAAVKLVPNARIY